MRSFVRLYISPFSEDLLPKLLASSLLSVATNVSLHEIETFPERPYGFVDLPAMEATKLKKKLNGTTLKGQKVKIEEARKDRRKDRANLGEAEKAEGEDVPILRKSERKRKREHGVLPGHDLPENRRVRRGWTEPVATDKARLEKKASSSKATKAGKKRSKPSAYTDESECLFQTKLPATKSNPKSEGKKKGRNKDAETNVVVHEFEKNVKHPSFVRNDLVSKAKKSIQEYDDEKGWVDEAGAVVDPPKRSRRKTKVPKSEDRQDKDEGKDNMDLDETLDLQEVGAGRKSGVNLTLKESQTQRKRSDRNSSPQASALNNLPSLEVTQSSPTAAEPHPLETLFKKPKPPTSNPDSSGKPDLEVKIPFSFFGEEEVDPTVKASMETPGLPRARRSKASGLPNLSIPVTPYTQRDMQWRSQRSAAPTPDTAAPGKSGFGDMWNRLREERDEDIEEEEEEEEEERKGDEDEDEDEGEEEDMQADRGSTGDGEGVDAGKVGSRESNNAGKEETGFTKWFWENRGENNRAWKRRRREAAKEQRQRENRRRKKIN